MAHHVYFQNLNFGKKKSWCLSERATCCVRRGGSAAANSEAEFEWTSLHSMPSSPRMKAGLRSAPCQLTSLLGRRASLGPSINLDSPRWISVWTVKGTPLWACTEPVTAIDGVFVASACPRWIISRTCTESGAQCDKPRKIQRRETSPNLSTKI
jgi:hypothetical protein